MRNPTRFLVALILLGLTSCASNQLTVEIRSTPRGARTYINGTYTKVTPCPVTFDFTESKYNTLQLVLEGHPVVWGTYTRAELEGKDFIEVPMR